MGTSVRITSGFSSVVAWIIGRWSAAVPTTSIPRYYGESNDLPGARAGSATDGIRTVPAVQHELVVCFGARRVAGVDLLPDLEHTIAVIVP